MKTSRQTNKNHWIGVGRRAKATGLAIEKVLTKREAIDAWIREGYGPLSKADMEKGLQATLGRQLSKMFGG